MKHVAIKWTSGLLQQQCCMQQRCLVHVGVCITVNTAHTHTAPACKGYGIHSCSNQSTEAYTTPTVVEPWHQFVHDVLHGTVGPQVLSRLGLMDEHITSWAVSVGLDILDNAGLADCREEEVHAVAASPSA